ncbi:hypothetical protein DL237_08470 [Pseudooceanicola sediminis]|uniref:Uncharacterized protein n=1 Tax=Pseudooceanicola sediminis TaxID=2211117 RepID=A0A399J1F0_9RHOB|nr:hypothetical protein [Pseudooceanicola sediminis]KAA2316265.1 hypothetical protein E0K93_05325 [Puniceibacterium sp. HSS470]RII39175.1 hypothetical protein DL237_08470 [Pseudooceanicola sediminis]|tara:strand:- start:69177 stop:69455 length:279 start_codon:yes stop_codon:yes gene_type:complete
MPDDKTTPLRNLLLIAPLLVALWGCNRPPALDATLSTANREAAYPDLVPGSRITSRTQDQARLDTADDDALAARAADLRRRADDLRTAEIGL